jgi:hypothetical protein
MKLFFLCLALLAQVVITIAQPSPGQCNFTLSS